MQFIRTSKEMHNFMDPILYSARGTSLPVSFVNSISGFDYHIGDAVFC
jgi:hypothetical protein